MEDGDKQHRNRAPRIVGKDEGRKKAAMWNYDRKKGGVVELNGGSFGDNLDPVNVVKGTVFEGADSLD